MDIVDRMPCFMPIYFKMQLNYVNSEKTHFIKIDPKRDYLNSQIIVKIFFTEI